MHNRVSTGIKGIDLAVDFLRLGENVVWQVDDIEGYKRLVAPFIRQALADQRQIIYVRFAAHHSLLEPEFMDSPIKTCTLKADQGFDSFASQLYQLVTDAGRNIFYVFDCLSDLLDQWSSDLMIGNFFRITCPYLFELDTVAYFAIKHGAHSFDTIARIRETTQLLINLYHQDGIDYIHPLKVWQRYSPTMFLPHQISGDQCIPITSSADAARLFAGTNPLHYQATRQIDYWDRLFFDAEQLLHSKQPDTPPTKAEQAIFRRLCDLLIGDEGKISHLAQQYFQLEDLIRIKKRQIGTGKIGGKAVGMLLARKILETKAPVNPQLGQIELEPHDSFYLGSDLFYTYIVQNGWWKLRTEQKTSEGYYSKARILREKILSGKFPFSVREQFQQMLEYFGQSPIIVRSNSLLEDDYGNAFAGKYESVFCANQGSPEDRYNAFEKAVRVVYASTMDESALNYRRKRGLQQKDEQMALLVQRVSGTYHGHFFYPMLAGVGYSNNLYVWNKLLDPKVGMLRLVFGLGTRAVGRMEKDYPRIVALDRPQLSNYENRDAEKTYSQHYVDLIDLAANRLTTLPLEQLIQEDQTIELDEVGEVDWTSTRHLATLGIPNRPQWILNFKKILSEKYFINDMHTILNVLEKSYECPVDIEFAVNQSTQLHKKINLLQCRPLQTKCIGSTITFPDNIDKRDIIIRSKGHFMGGNVRVAFKYMIYVRPDQYVKLIEQERYQVARIIGQLNQKVADPEKAPTMLLGPGRWGTTTPSLGIPVHFSEINNIVALGEIAFETAGMMPEISYGSHFFQDLVETNVFYLAILPHMHDNIFNAELILNHSNLLSHFFPQHQKWESVITVCDYSKENLILFSDILSQKLLCIQGSGMQNTSRENKKRPREQANEK